MCLEEDAFKRNTLSTDTYPAGSIASTGMACNGGPNSLHRYGRKFQEFTRSLCVAKSRLDPGSDGVHGQILLALMFVALSARHQEAFTNFVLEWKPDDFVFREYAFAILSLASGQVLFHSFPRKWCDPSYCTEGDHEHPMGVGYIRAPRELGLVGSKVLPEFATGTHRPGEDAGSAPLETMYWFEDVLVCLATFIHQKDVHDATIAKLARFGIQNGRKNFQGVILSLLDCILLEVQVVNETTMIKHTKVIGLSHIWPDNHLSARREARPPVGGDDSLRRLRGLKVLKSGVGFTALDSLNQHFFGFIALIRFFETAANRRVRSSNDYGRFPTEIYFRIIDFSHDATYLSWAKVSRIFRTYCLPEFRLGGTKSVIRHDEPMTLTLVDRMTGTVGEFKPYQLDANSIPRYNWSPIVGVFGRPSIINNVRLVFNLMVRSPTGELVEKESDSDYDAD
jgi:hypothetical protein